MGIPFISFTFFFVAADMTSCLFNWYRSRVLKLKRTAHILLAEYGKLLLDC